MNIHWTLPCEVSSVSDARWALRSMLEEAGSTVDQSDAAAMVITELLANAIVHSEHRTEYVDVVVQSSAEQIHIEVTDHNPQPPVAREISVDAPSGRGLTIVDALSSAWGWDRIEGDRKRVWCDVPMSGWGGGGPGGPGGHGGSGGQDGPGAMFAGQRLSPGPRLAF